MVITFSNIKGSAGGGGGATGGTVSGITLWSDETTKAYIDNALSGVTDVLSAYTKTEDFATINGSAITSGGNIVIEATPYTAGTNIDITDHVISVTGITIPTKVSELVNDKGYITTADTQNFVTSGDVQTQINDSISGKADSSAVTAQISEVKAQIEAEIPSKVSDLQNDLNFASTGDVKTQVDNAVSGKQDTLVSGTNIKTINNQSILGSGNLAIEETSYSAGEGIGIDADNIISVTGNYETIVELTQSEYDALTSYGKNTTYVITDAPAVNLSAYTPTSGFSTINGSAITEGGNLVIEETSYTAGANIDISTDNVISVTGITVPTSNTAFTNDAGYITSGEVETQITGKNYATESWVQDNINLAIESETARTEATYAKIGDIPSLDGYATTGWVESQGYLTEHQDISGKLDTSDFTAYTANTQTELNNKQDASAMTEYATTAFTESTYLKEHQSLSAYSTTEQVQTLINTAKQEVENEIPDVSNFVTSAQVETQITDKGYLTGYTESDPVFQASAASGITANDITNWNAKLDSSDLEPYYTSAQTNNVIYDAVSGKADSSAVTAQISEVKAQIEAEIPSKVSDLENDLNFVNSGDVKTQVESYNYINSGQAQTQIDNSISGKLDTDIFTAYTANTKTELNNKQDASGMTAYATTAFTENTYAKIGDIPTKTSDLTNDSGFITDAALSGYATEQYVDNSVSGKVDNSALTQYYTSAQTDTAIQNATNGLASEEWVNNQGFLKEHQSLSAYSTTEQMNQAIGSATAATTGWVESQGYLKEHQSLSAYTPTSGFSTINGSAITEGGNIVVEETPYSGGTNIDITNHIISVTGITIPTSNTAFTNDAGYVNSGQAQTQIDNAVSGKQDTLVSGENIKTINNQSLLGSGNIEIQGGGETYSAGEGIGIDADNIISVTGNYETIVEITQAEYNALTSYDKNTTYVITDAPAVNLSAYTPTSGFSTINGNVITDGGNLVIEATPYTAGANIDITDHIISVTGITIPTSNTAFTNDAGYVNSGEVETQITSKGYITGYTETDPVFQASAASGITSQDISNWNNKLDSSALNPYYTSAQTDTAISNAVSGKQDTLVSGTNIKTINNQSLLGSGNIQIQGGSGGSSYTAGNNIDITNDVISVTGLATINGSAITEGGNIVIQGGSGGGSNIIELTQAEYDALTAYTEDAIYVITDSQAINMDNYATTGALGSYYTSAETDTAISNAVSGKTDKVSVTANGSGFKFPAWNNQGCITGTNLTAYQASQSINGSSRILLSNSSSSLPTIYAPTSAGSAGQPLLSNGSGAPVWGAYKFQFISQSQYDALATKDSTTIYFIVNEN